MATKQPQHPHHAPHHHAAQKQQQAAAMAPADADAAAAGGAATATTNNIETSLPSQPVTVQRPLPVGLDRALRAPGWGFSGDYRVFWS